MSRLELTSQLRVKGHNIVADALETALAAYRAKTIKVDQLVAAWRAANALLLTVNAE